MIYRPALNMKMTANAASAIPRKRIVTFRNRVSYTHNAMIPSEKIQPMRVL